MMIDATEELLVQAIRDNLQQLLNGGLGAEEREVVSREVVDMLGRLKKLGDENYNHASKFRGIL